MIITQVLKRVKEADFVRYINGQFLDKNNAEISVVTEGGGGGGSGDITQDVINAADPKTTPADADKIPLTDYAAGGLLKYFTLLNLKDLIVTYLKTLDFVRVNSSKDLLSGSDVVVTQAATGMRYGFLAATGLTDPTSGLFKSSVNLTVTVPASNSDIIIMIDNLDKNGTDMSGFMSAWLAGGTLYVRSATSTDISFFVVSITSAANQDPDTYFQVSGKFLGGSLFSGGESCVIQYIPPTNIATAIDGASSKAAPVDADKLGLVDSAASGALKYLSWANLKASINTYTQTLGYTKLDASGNLINPATSLPVDGVNTVYALASKPVTGIPELPAATDVTDGTVIRLHPDCFLGAGGADIGGNKGGVLIRSIDSLNRWVPATGRALILSKRFGTAASPTVTMTSTTQATSSKFALTTDPIIPAGLFYAGAKFELVFRLRRNVSVVALGTITLQAYLGTSATQNSNSIIWQGTMADTDNIDVYPAPVIEFLTATSVESTRNLSKGGSGIASSYTTSNTLINSAAEMNLSWKMVTTLDANNTVDFLGYELWWVE